MPCDPTAAAAPSTAPDHHHHPRPYRRRRIPATAAVVVAARPRPRRHRSVRAIGHEEGTLCDPSDATKAKTPVKLPPTCTFTRSGRRESNPRLQLGNKSHLPVEATWRVSVAGVTMPMLTAVGRLEWPPMARDQGNGCMATRNRVCRARFGRAAWCNRRVSRFQVVVQQALGEGLGGSGVRSCSPATALVRNVAN